MERAVDATQEDKECKRATTQVPTARLEVRDLSDPSIPLPLLAKLEDETRVGYLEIKGID